MLLCPRKGLRKAGDFTNISQLLSKVSNCFIFFRSIIRIWHGTWREGSDTFWYPQEMQPKVSKDSWLRKLHTVFIQSPYGRGVLCFGGRQPPSLSASKPSWAQEGPCGGAQQSPASPGTPVSLLWKPGYRKKSTYVSYRCCRARMPKEAGTQEGLSKMAWGAPNTEFRWLAIGSLSHRALHAAPELQQAPV